MLRILAAVSAALLLSSAALADFTGKNAAGLTITFKNSGDCTSVVCVVQQQPVDSTGAAFGVTANPFFVTSTTLATAANQSTANASLATIATNSGAPIPTQAVTVPIGGVSNDPCSYAAKTNLPISFQTTSITQQIALSGSTKIYVCSMSLIASVATVFSVTGGTGTNCGTPAALIGTTSATHGLSLAANGGMTLGNGSGTVAVTGAGSELCLVQSGAGDLVGNLTYVQQ